MRPQFTINNPRTLSIETKTDVAKVNMGVQLKVVACIYSKLDSHNRKNHQRYHNMIEDRNLRGGGNDDEVHSWLWAICYLVTN